jgi:hypothetical protein
MFVVRFELGSEAASLHPNDRIHPRIVIRLSVEYFDAQEILLEFVSAPGQGALHHAAQESRHPVRVRETGTVENSIEFRANVTRIHSVAPVGRGVPIIIGRFRRKNVT